MTQYTSGIDGENIAERYLTQQGMQCIERRYRAADGQIDLIMLDQSYIVFVQVKYRPTSHAGHGLLAVTQNKQRRMTHAAMVYILQKSFSSYQPRFDVIEITMDGIQHIPNAFYARR